MTAKRLFSLGWRFLVLTVLYVVILSVGGSFLGTPIDPSFLAEHQNAMMLGSVLVAAVHTLLVMMLILRSSWSGWPLMLAVGFAFYGVTTFLSILEIAYFGPAMGIPPQVLPGLLLGNLPLALVWVPLAAILLGRGRRLAADRAAAKRQERRRMSAGQWMWKLALIALAYLAIYFVFGVVVAWQNPELRAMYGDGANAQVFSLWLIPFQALRALLWVLFGLPVIRMTRGRTWQVALVVALLYSLAPAIGLVTPNPYMPVASARLSHFFELLTSNFLFGWLLTALLLWRPRRAAEASASLAGSQASAR
jgi:hypothetical protein